MRIAIIGKGRVGSALGPTFKASGHDVAYGVRKPGDAKHENGDGIALKTTADAAEWAQVVILSVGWATVETALADCGDMVGKVLIDCTNPLNYDPVTGLSLAIGFSTSAGEFVSARTKARVVKALNQVGSPVMAVARDYPVRPIQFMAGEDAGAKEIVSGLLRDIGFEPHDYGGIENARKLEPLAMIWIDQAFKHGMDPLTAWSFTRLDK